jgi:hypothetical protein
MAALRPVAQVSRFLSLLPPISDPAEKVVVALLVQDSTGMAVSVKDMVKSPSPVGVFFGEGFSIRTLVCNLISHVKCRSCLRRLRLLRNVRRSQFLLLPLREFTTASL